METPIDEFVRRVVKAHEVMRDDWIRIAEGLFRVIDTGHVLTDVTNINHTVLILQPVWTKPAELIQLVIPLDLEMCILNQK